MMKKKNYIQSIFVALLAAALFSSNSGGYSGNLTGSMNSSGTCGSCHSGGTYSTSAGISGLPTVFDRSQTYSLTITANVSSMATATAAGFQVEAVNATTGASYGTIAPGGGASGTKVAAAGVIGHNAPKPLSSGATSWTFNWTPPASYSQTDDVQFYYVVNVVDGGGGTSDDEVVAGVSSAIALPLQLTSFDAEAKNQMVNLSWTSEQERNFSHYELERRADNEKFTTIAKINASSAGRYQHTDENIKARTAYYRLKMIDQDGTAKYSQIIATKVNTTEWFSAVVPSTINSGDVISLRFQKSNFAPANVYVINISGQVVATQTVTIFNEQASINLPELATGQYFVSIESEGKKATKKIFVR